MYLRVFVKRFSGLGYSQVYFMGFCLVTILKSARRPCRGLAPREPGAGAWQRGPKAGEALQQGRRHGERDSAHNYYPN